MATDIYILMENGIPVVYHDFDCPLKGEPAVPRPLTFSDIRYDEKLRNKFSSNFPTEYEKFIANYCFIKKGDKITCGKCTNVIYIAAEDIEFGSPMQSKNLTHSDGTPVAFHARKECPHCQTIFTSISSETKQTY